MAGSLHGSARTTPRVRAELQASKETTGALAQRYGLSRTTVTKWRARNTTDDAPMGPTSPHSTVLTLAEEAMIVEFRRRTLLPLDDVPRLLARQHPKAHALQSVPLPRATRHLPTARVARSKLQAGQVRGNRDRIRPHRHQRTPPSPGQAQHVPGNRSRVQVQTYVEFRDDAGKMNGAEFLRGVVEAFPYAIHTVLTDNGMAFADLPKNRNGPTRRHLGAHILDRVCNENGIEHKLTKPYHPWTNAQAERMNRTVKEATIKAFHYRYHLCLDLTQAMAGVTLEEFDRRGLNSVQRCGAVAH